MKEKKIQIKKSEKRKFYLVRDDEGYYEIWMQIPYYTNFTGWHIPEKSPLIEGLCPNPTKKFFH